MTITVVEPIRDHIVTIVDEGASIADRDPITVTQTVEGEQGLSAYRIAVLNGFSGSQAEWLASLKGQPGDSVVTDPGDFTLIFTNALI